ncbi:TPA: hypothetical protein ACNABU_003890 [Citrobacter amalonaticus]
MTTNHPAHGPVSLDRLHQIREHLLHETRYSNGGNRAYILADVLKVIDGAIAAFGAEPVLYAAEETLAYAKMGELHLKCLSQPMGDAVIPLYVHRQATDEIGSWNNHRNTPTAQAGNHTEKHLDMVDHSGDANKKGNSPVIPDGVCPCCGRKPLKYSKCSVQGCGRKHVAHGVCQRHYDMKRREDPEQVEKFREANRRFTARKRANKAAPQQEVR